MLSRIKKPTIVGYQDTGGRSQIIVNAALAGARTLGLQTQLFHANTYNGRIDGDIAVIYGLKDKLRSVFHTYKNSGKKCVFIDLGFFGRHDGGRTEGFHRVAVNDYFTAGLLKQPHRSMDRLDRFGLQIKPMRPPEAGKYILVAGMSEKSAGVYGLRANEWETHAITELRKRSQLPIVYRPKPSWQEAMPIPGALYSPREQDLADVLQEARLVVTHHSNVAIEALIEGIPAIVTCKSAASELSGQAFDDIGRLPLPDVETRRQWLANLCWHQWRVAEMRDGSMWRSLFKSGSI